MRVFVGAVRVWEGGGLELEYEGEEEEKKKMMILMMVDTVWGVSVRCVVTSSGRLAPAQNQRLRRVACSSDVALH